MPEFGTRVRTTVELERRVIFEEPQGHYLDKDYKPRRTLKVWETVPIADKVSPTLTLRSRNGIIIGKRVLKNGEREYLGEDEGIAFLPTDSFVAYLVAYSMHRAPYYVREEDLEIYNALPRT